MESKSKARRREQGGEEEEEGADSMSLEELRPAKRPLFACKLRDFEEKDRYYTQHQLDEMDVADEEEGGEEEEEEEEDDLSSVSASFLLEARFETLSIARRELSRVGGEERRTTGLAARLEDG